MVRAYNKGPSGDVHDFSPSLSNISSKPDRTRRSFNVLSPNFSNFHGMEPSDHWDSSSFLPPSTAATAVATTLPGGGGTGSAPIVFVWMSWSALATGAYVL